jgi:hypothetical protein
MIIHPICTKLSPAFPIDQTIIRTSVRLSDRATANPTIDYLQAEGMPCVFIGRIRRFILSEVIAWLKRKGGRS